MKLLNPEVRIENTNLCNAHCVICPREKLTRKKTTMPFMHFKKLVDEAKQIGADTISIFGFGEPLLDNDLESKVRYCSDKKLFTFITTNASLLTPTRAVGLINAGLGHIRFSCHGVYNNYDEVHKGLNFSDTHRNIANFLKINSHRYDHPVKTSVTVIPMHGESVNDLLDFWGNMDDIEVWKPHNWTDGKGFRELGAKKKTCGRPFTGPVQINADGSMMVCCFDFNATLTVGDTYRNTISEILGGERFNLVREAHRTGNLTGLICETCDQLNAGDKPLLYSTRDPDCNIGVTSSTKFKLKEM